MKKYQYKFTDLEINAEEVAFPMGYNEGEVPEEILDLINIELEKLKDIEEIRSIILTLDLKIEDDAFILGNQLFKIGSKVHRFLRKAEKVAIFQCTAGKTISELGNELMAKGDVLEGFIVDTIGTVAVEKAMDITQKSLEDELALDNNKITNRYSPGYCEWDIMEQFKLFEILSGDYCGITLAPSALMLPVKSISGFIGIGLDVSFKPYSCDFCTQQTCIYSKRKRENKNL